MEQCFGEQAGFWSNRPRLPRITTARAARSLGGRAIVQQEPERYDFYSLKLKGRPSTLLLMWHESFLLMGSESTLDVLCGPAGGLRKGVHHEKDNETARADPAAGHCSSFAGGPFNLPSLLRVLALSEEQRLHGGSRWLLQPGLPQDWLLRLPVRDIQLGGPVRTGGPV